MWLTTALLCCILLHVHLAVAYDYNYCAAPLQLSVTNTNLTLQFVQVVTRHGDRTTLTQLPGDHHVWQCNLTTFMAPSQDQQSTTPTSRLFRKNYLPGREPTPGNCYGGQLTTRGFEQHVVLGQSLRALYVDTYKFLPPVINASIMGIRSTDIPRTLASAQGNSLGLYPAESTASNAVPVIDVFTMDSSFENMYPNGGLCPRADQLLNEVNSEPAYVAYMETLLPLQQHLSQVLDIPLANLPDWPGLLDAFEVMTCYDQTYPGLDSNTINQVFEAANWQWNYQLNNSQLALLQLGSFATELVQNIQSLVNGDPMPKYLVFSGHDTTLGPLLATLEVYDGQWPPYASHVEFEVWSGEDDYYVQVKYQGNPLVLPTCSAALCPFPQFMKLVEPIISVDYPTACMAQ